MNNDKNSLKQIEQITNEAEKEIYSSNVIENVSYKANDNRGNEYAINALTGEIDIKDNDIELEINEIENKAIVGIISLGV